MNGIPSTCGWGMVPMAMDGLPTTLGFDSAGNQLQVVGNWGQFAPLDIPLGSSMYALAKYATLHARLLLGALISRACIATRKGGLEEWRYLQHWKSTSLLRLATRSHG